MITFFKKIIHFLFPILGMCIYNFPAKKIITIGITGTKGKTSTINFIHNVLNQKFKTGLISTANIKIGNQEIENTTHMSMPGKFFLQKLIKKMKSQKCEVVIVEITSEGIKQFRHLGLFLDIAVWTNLSPEHLHSHDNSFEKYRKTKMKIFKKNFFNKLKFVLLNQDDENFKYFSEYSDVEKKYFSLKEVENIAEKKDGVDFIFEKENYHINLLGKFNIYNVLPAIKIAEYFHLEKDLIKKGLAELKNISGRMEEIKMGQNFKVIIDYAHEKLSMTNLLETAKNLKVREENKIIIVLGGDGGGRDEQRLFDMGEVVGKKSDVVIVSNSDPYFDDEMMLAKKIADEAKKNGKVYDTDLFIILDREEAIKKAIQISKEGDIILLTTRGSLNFMSIKGKKIKSNDKEIVERILKEKI